jgi:hypothetical protein
MGVVAAKGTGRRAVIAEVYECKCTFAELIRGWLRIATGWLRPATGGQTLHHEQIGAGDLVIHTGP